MIEPYYEESGITIYHGDCLALLEHLDAHAAIVTDPPYGIGFHFERTWHSRHRGSLVWSDEARQHAERQWFPVIGDEHPFDPTPWCAFAHVILWGANHYADRLPPATRWLVWDKKPGMQSDNHGDCELAWTNLSGPIRRFAHLWRGIVRAGAENVVHGGKLHPCQKPLALMEWCIQMTSGPVIDPYMGSGTTLLAAKELGRRAIGIEIEERYCEIAVNRLRQQVLDLDWPGAAGGEGCSMTIDRCDDCDAPLCDEDAREPMPAPTVRFDGVIGGPPCQAFSCSRSRGKFGPSTLASLCPWAVRWRGRQGD